MTIVTTTEQIKAANSAVMHDLDFDSIKSHVDDVAQNILQPAIGGETYLLLVGAGTAGVLGMARAIASRAEANLAVASYTAFGSVQLGENGATVFQSNTYKIASDKKVSVLVSRSEQTGYGCLEALLSFMESNIGAFPAYSNSPERKYNRSSFINYTVDFNKAQHINGNFLLFRSLRTFIRDAEEQYIEPLLGGDYTESLRAAVAINDCTDIQTELIKNISRVVAQYAIADAIRYNAVTLDANGVFTNTVGASAGQANTEKQTVAEIKRLTMAVAISTEKGDKAMSRLRRFIIRNKDALTGIKQITEGTRSTLNDVDRGVYLV